MQNKANKALVPLARALRQRMTKEERKLWFEFLRGYPVRFRRQDVLGKYIVDFYCAQAKLVVELDGSQHFDDDAARKDAERTTFLEGYGLRIVRIPNNELVSNFARVCDYIDAIVQERLEK